MCTTDDQGFSLEQLDCEQKDRSHPLETEVKTLLLLGVYVCGVRVYQCTVVFLVPFAHNDNGKRM